MFAKSRFYAAILLVIGVAASSGRSQDLLVCDEDAASIYRFGPAGALRSYFAGPRVAGMGDHPRHMIHGPNGQVYVSFADPSQEGGWIWRFDTEAGRSLGYGVPFGVGGLDRPIGMVFGPDGLLYVCNSATDEILRFTADGEFVDVFVSAGSGGLDLPHRGILFDRDGSLLVAGLRSNAVHRYDGLTGEFLGYAIAPGALGLEWPTGMVMDAEGVLHVCGYRSRSIYSLDPDGTLRSRWQFLLTAPEDIAILDDGTFVVANADGEGQVYRYSSAWAWLGQWPRREQRPSRWKPVSLLVMSEQPEPCPADFDGDGELTVLDFLAFQTAFMAGCN